MARKHEINFLYCSNQSEPCETGCDCILFKVKEPWINAGLDIIIYSNMTKHLVQLLDKYYKLQINIKRFNANDLENMFLTNLKKVFYIG